MIIMLPYITRLLFCFILLHMSIDHIMANDKVQKNNTFPAALYFGVDFAKTCTGWYNKTGSMYEINGSIDLNNILLDVDYGFGAIHYDKQMQKGSFSHTDGRYFRVGLGYNLLSSTFDHNQFFIGLRYARSFFNFQLKSNKLQCKHKPEEDCKQRCSAPLSLSDLKGKGIAHWWEIIAGGKVRVINIVYIGCTARYKFGKKMEDKLHILPFDIPGFGLEEHEHAFGYSFYIILGIPLQKEMKTAKTATSTKKL
ncbi:hypothetical protein CCPUN_09350 [Cardinium endosymbiont of Culicoides punctatus]|nr:hypothetical protein CCPUN_09350 [Cardinium endosymbiont of Culicoides punctatus]